MNKTISILGSTGSIGVQALDVAEKLNLKISALTANKSVKALEEQIRKYRPQIAVLMDEKSAEDLKIRTADTSVKILTGMDGLIAAASEESADMVLNSVVGMIGLEPTLAAINAKKDIALANKETLVAGGEIVMQSARENGVNIYPVDSEHSAIFQCLQGMNSKKDLKRLILTASGGPFFGKTKDDLRDVKPEQALKHPNWSMGAKITIDSATMMNKGLEVIEACWLFDTNVEQIDVVVHRESIIHSLIEYNDNSVIAQLGVPDMRIPIQYALTYPDRIESPSAQLDLAQIGKMTFFSPDNETFECLDICKEAIRRGSLAPAAANGANEQAVELFLRGEIPFLEIAQLVRSAMENQPIKADFTLEDILNADRAAREFVKTNLFKR